MTPQRSIRTLLAGALLILLGACDLLDFSNDQIPECKQLTGDTAPDILTCFNPLYFSLPDWHPGGTWIAAEHADSIDTNEDGVPDTWFAGIWLVHAQSGETRPLLPFGGAPDWNPAGTHLAIDTPGNIYTVEITSLDPPAFDTSSITLLTPFDARSFYPTWSGDGQRIAFETNYNHENGAYYVWSIGKNGADLQKISQSQSGGSRAPDWSYKNASIAFTSSVSGNTEGPEVLTMNSDGSGSKQLTDSGGNYSPKFSRDGTKIAYEHRPEGLSSSLWVMDADGSNKKPIAKYWSSNLAWSPDGTQIVYVFSNQYFQGPGNGQLWIMDADGSNKRPLTDVAPAIPGNHEKAPPASTNPLILHDQKSSFSHFNIK
ncbi:MAG: hypothetical protein AAFW89_01940 [Bacteroidota bacterium]